jgi:hypothetical protein
LFNITWVRFIFQPTLLWWLVTIYGAIEAIKGLPSSLHFWLWSGSLVVVSMIDVIDSRCGCVFRTETFPVFVAKINKPVLKDVSLMKSTVVDRSEP